MEKNDSIELITSKIDKYPNYPKEGVLFYDIFSLLKDYKLSQVFFEVCEKRIREILKDKLDTITTIVGLESRGLMLGLVFADRLKKNFVGIRKKGKKFPGELFEVEYKTEYSTDWFVMQKHAIDKDSRVLIIDDLIATGGTLKASEDLIHMADGKVEGVFCPFEIKKIDGRSKLTDPSKFFSLVEI